MSRLLTSGLLGLALVAGCVSTEQQATSRGTGAAVSSAAVAAAMGELQVLHETETIAWLAALSDAERQWHREGAERVGIPLGSLMTQFTRRGVVRGLWGWNLQLPVEGAPTADSAARGFLQRWAPAFGLTDPSREVAVARTWNDALGNSYVRFDQRTLSGLPVFNTALLITFDRSLRVSSVSGMVTAQPPEGPSVITDAAAALAARRHAAAEGVVAVSVPLLGVYDPEIFESPGQARLAWRVEVGTAGSSNWSYFIDARSGDVLFRFDRVLRHRRRETYWMNHMASGSPGTLIYRDDPPFWYGSWPGTSLHVDLGNLRTWNYYNSRHGRDGWENNLLPSTYHRQSTTSDYGIEPLNAFWCCDGCAAGLCRFEPASLYRAFFGDETACPDVVTHELTHGVTEVEALLGSTGQTGALNESLSDAFGQFAERHSSGSTDWIIGTGGTCLPRRNLADPEAGCGPGTETYCTLNPAHFSCYGGCVYNNGPFVHNDSGIPSKAAWLLGREPAEGTVAFAGISVTGIGEVDTGRLWYDVVINRLTSTTNFTQFRSGVRLSAGVLFGSGTTRYYEAIDAVDAVGLWTGDFNQLFDTDNAVSLDVYSVAGAGGGRYLTHREPLATGAHVQIRKWTCDPPFNICYWGSPTNLGITTHAPTTEIYPVTSGGENKLWVFYKGDGVNSIYYRYLSSDGTWSSETLLPAASTDDDPWAVAFGGFLYVFYKRPPVGAQPVNFVRYSPSTGWQGSVATAAQSLRGPVAVGPLAGSLYLIYLNGPGAPPQPPNLKYRTSTNPTSGFGAEQLVPNGYSLTTPTAAIFRNRLHVAVRDSNQIGEPISYASYCPSGAGCTYRPGSWTNVVIQDPGVQNFVTLHADTDGRLYLYHNWADRLQARSKISE